MMGENDNQGVVFHTVRIEDHLPTDPPLLRIRKMVNTERIHELCAPLYCTNNGRQSIPPEQLFLAMLGGYLMGVRLGRIPSVDFKGKKRSNATHLSTTDPDARIATKSSKETAVQAYTVNGMMENRNRILA